MADFLDRIVKVSITRQTVTPSMASFSGVLIAAEFLKAVSPVAWTDAERVRSYPNLAAVAADGFGTSTYVYKAAERIFAQNPRISRVYVGRKKTGADGTEDWATALTAMAVANTLWYGLVTDTRTRADQEDIADWTEANKKLYSAVSADSNLITVAYNAGTPGDIADYVKASALNRTMVSYDPAAGTGNDKCLDAGIFGRTFHVTPGSINYAFKTIAGILPAPLTETEADFLDGKNCNYYISVADINMFQTGRVGSGEWVDIIHGLDYYDALIKNFVLTPLVQSNKVNFDNSGIEVVSSQLASALQAGVDNSFFTSFEITVPDDADVPAGDKSSRTLKEVNFTAFLAGAINITEINGIVTY